MTEALPRKQIVGYADRMSACWGDRIRFMVSCEDVPEYRAEIVRLVSGDRHPEGLGFIEKPVGAKIPGRHAGRRQPLHAGSYGIIDNVSAFQSIGDFTLQAMIWPTAPGGRRQIIMGRWLALAGTGFALILDAQGALALEIGDGTRIETIAADTPLRAREWAFVAASFEVSTRTVRLYQEPASGFARQPTHCRREAVIAVSGPAAGHTPFMIAAGVATSGNGRVAAGDHFNGKIDKPLVVAAALQRAAMESLRRREVALPTAVLAAWDFSQAMTTDRIIDRSPLGHHGRLINLPTRAMKGHNWTGEVLDWKAAPEQYGAIHFHDDDLYDAGQPRTVPHAVRIARNNISKGRNVWTTDARG